MGLFDKKYCDVCGEKIGLLGNRKLEDGNLCKNCAAKLSPWFDDRRHSTLEEIKEQLAYREENQNAVAAFHMSRSFGSGWQILMIDEAARTFTVAEKSQLTKGNPDIINCAKITGCDSDIQERRNELKTKDKEGKMVSYNPPRYEYEYDFYYVIRVDHPYFDQIRFKLNSNEVKLSAQAGAANTRSANMRGSAVRSGAGSSVANARGSIGSRSSVFTPGKAEYQKYVNLASEISEVLMSLRDGGGSSSESSGIDVNVQSGLLYCYNNGKGLDATISYVLSGKMDYKIVNQQMYGLSANDISEKFPKIISSSMVSYFLTLANSGLEPAAILERKQEISDFVVKNSANMLGAFGMEPVSLQIDSFDMDQKSKELLEGYNTQANLAGGDSEAMMQQVMAQVQSDEWVCEFCDSKNNGGKFCTVCGAPRG